MWQMVGNVDVSGGSCHTIEFGAVRGECPVLPPHIIGVLKQFVANILSPN